MNILIAPNSFKECADSVKIAQIISRALAQTKHNLIIKPLTDGGDGFLSVIQSIFEVETLKFPLKNCYDENYSDYIVLYERKHKQVFVESAELFGLKIIPPEKRNPSKLNSSILGELLIKLAQQVESNNIEIENVCIGIGGTATIDFAIGALTKLGLELYDEKNNLFEALPIHFNQVAKIENKINPLPFSVSCIVDVDTPLIGNPGSIEIYGNQKGAVDAELKIIKDGINNILHLLNKDSQFQIKDKLNGSGGGFGAGFEAVLNTKLISAEMFIKDFILNDVVINNVDVVITGEGNFDFQSFEGKGVGTLLNIFTESQIPIFIICGISKITDEVLLNENIHIIKFSDYFENVESSIKNFETGILKSVESICNLLHK